jgi:hypothetical protein
MISSVRRKCWAIASAAAAASRAIVASKILWCSAEVLVQISKKVDARTQVP